MKIDELKRGKMKTLFCMTYKAADYDIIEINNNFAVKAIGPIKAELNEYQDNSPVLEFLNLGRIALSRGPYKGNPEEYDSTCQELWEAFVLKEFAYKNGFPYLGDYSTTPDDKMDYIVVSTCTKETKFMYWMLERYYLDRKTFGDQLWYSNKLLSEYRTYNQLTPSGNGYRLIEKADNLATLAMIQFLQTLFTEDAPGIVRCANPKCRRIFTPTHHNQKYCGEDDCNRMRNTDKVRKQRKKAKSEEEVK
jgi:hypothetical protein